MKKLTRRRRKPSEIDQQREAKRKRIVAMYPRERVEKILRTEDKWGALAISSHTYREICLTSELLRFDPVHRLIYGSAYRWARTYQYIRLTFEDFLSAFYEAVWMVIDGYTWATDFYLYETLSQAIQKRGQSIRRAAMTDKQRAFHEALPLVDDL